MTAYRLVRIYFLTLGGSYVTAKRNLNNPPPHSNWSLGCEYVLNVFFDHCEQYQLPHTQQQCVLSPDTSTLFCTSGMQKHKPLFGKSPPLKTTLCDSQTCLRTTDLDEFGDRTHRIVFNMLGLFSFEHWDLPQTFGFWLTFVRRLGLEPHSITVHPQRLDTWRPIWRQVGYQGRIDPDEQCIWSDGSIGGYCTEMYVDGIEIGNIVNPLGHSIDCGFGLERLVQVMGYVPPPPSEHLVQVLHLLHEQGIFPSGKGSGSVVRQIVRKGLHLGIDPHLHPWLHQMHQRLEQQRHLYERLVSKHPDKDPSWWYQTHGIEVPLLLPHTPNPAPEDRSTH